MVRIVHEAAGWVVVEKSPNFLSVPGKGPHKQDCVVARVRELLPRALGPMVVHRLDWETSGLLVLGLTPDAQRELSRQFEARTVRKSYVALLDGQPEQDAGEVSLPMRADITRRPIQIVDHEHGRPASTRWRAIAREIDRCRVEFVPITGRTHQLRLHAATPADQGGIGCPIVGDPLYGREGDRLMLHASTLAFTDPDTGRAIEFSSRTPF